MPAEASERGSIDSPSLRDAACQLAESGWAVFPCGEDKAPLVARGFHAASADERVVLGMTWDRAALIGAAIPEGCVVLDVDPRNGGDETMQALKDAGHKLPRTRVVRTGGGGTHYYFRVPEGVELRAHLGRGVDVKRAGRGYVIVPPSPGYSVLRHDPAAELPEWLLEALRVPERVSMGSAATSPKFMQWEYGTAYGRAALAAIVSTLGAAQPGSRNDALNLAAFAAAQLVAGGELDGDASRRDLETTADDLGLDANEIRKTIESGWEAGLAEPRSAPPRDAGAGDPTPDITDTKADTAGDLRLWLDWTTHEEPPAFLLDPILPENAYVLVYGPAEAAKSMVWAAIGADASRRGIRTTLYSLENPPHVDRDRLRRLRPDPANFRASNEPLDIGDPAQFRALVEREREWGTKLAIIDTYSHAFASRSEDGNARAIEFARRVRFLMHETGASIVVIDHTGYAHDEPRDASAKRQQVDVCVLMESTGQWEPGRPAGFRMENRKAARFGNPFALAGQIRGNRGEPLELAWTGKAPTWAG